jgi:poly-beta-1,6-N-acetyl-D-glucosamine synthase
MHTWVFWASVALLVYTFAGYPLGIWLWSRWSPRPIRPQAGWQPRVAMIVVVHNEGQRILDKMRSCLAQDYPATCLRVVVVSDGSTDNTVDRVKGLGEPRVVLHELLDRRGKANGLNEAVALCDEDVLVFTDARQMLNPQAVSHLVQTLSDPAVAVVSGELVFRSEGDGGFAQGVDAYWRYEKFMRKAEALVHSTAGATGALYAMRRSDYVPIASQTILDDVAIPMQACMAGGRIVFDARAQALDAPSKDIAAERRRKVRTLAGNFQLVALMPSLLLPWRNPIFLQFVSHKLLRLLAPWALLGALVSSAILALSSSFFMAVFMVQTAAYTLVLAGFLWPALLRWKPARLLQAFVTLNTFALLGLVEFVTNRQAHLWSSGNSNRQGSQAT